MLKITDLICETSGLHKGSLLMLPGGLWCDFCTQKQNKIWFRSSVCWGRWINNQLCHLLFRLPRLCEDRPQKQPGVLNILAKCCGSQSVTVAHLSFTLLAVTCVLTHVICWKDRRFSECEKHHFNISSIALFFFLPNERFFLQCTI